VEVVGEAGEKRLGMRVDDDKSGNDNAYANYRHRTPPGSRKGTGKAFRGEDDAGSQERNVSPKSEAASIPTLYSKPRLGRMGRRISGEGWTERALAAG